MSKKKKVAFFPMFSDTLPVVRYFLKYRDDIEVIELLSTKGSGACGKDASILDNREPLGINVHSFQEANANNWDVLYLLRHESFDFTGALNSDSMYLPMIQIAQKSHCKIANYSDVQNGTEDLIIHTSIPSDDRANVLKKLASPKQIKTFLVLVIGSISEANAFEVALNLYGEIKKHVRVIAFSSSKNAGACGIRGLYELIHACPASTEQKVFILAEEIEKTARENKAEIILLLLDEAIMPFNETQTNGFGIVPYIFSQFIVPDFCICCLPYGYSSTSFLKEFESGLDGRFGFLPDHWHLSNSAIDFTTLSSPRGIGAIHVPMLNVENTITGLRDSGFDIGCDVLPEYLNETIEKILSEFVESQLVESIF